MKIVLTIVISYLLGSCSTGIIYSKLSGSGDIRNKGSKNAGATNMLRVMGMKAAAITLIGDMLKGVIAALLGKWLVGGTFGAMLSSVFSVLGHNYPVFFGFKGGEGIATSFRSLLCCPTGAYNDFVCCLCCHGVPDPLCFPRLDSCRSGLSLVCSCDAEAV